MAATDPIIYAVGDIHGYADLLDDLIAQIERDAEKYPGRPIEVVFVGDYVDRGPDSRGVIARLREWKPAFSVTCLKGNHEQFLVQTIKHPGLELVSNMGQDETFASYLDREDELANDLYWMDNLPLTKQIEAQGQAYLFVHAGIIPDRPLKDQPDRALIWIRDEFLDYEGDHGFIVVHGHTPDGTGWPELKPNRINVDSGVFFSGRLTCVVLGDGEPRFLHAYAGEGWGDDV
ncbi:MAG: serine/threonine protein phosphatase [Alphaproteobacteria bacterium]|nr:serine/threonine protein phosphatase [Alphaproteobacteria bacterium]